jgi:hypothetical protein
MVSVVYFVNTAKCDLQLCRARCPGRGGREGAVSETRYLVPAGADWAAWDDVNGVLTFMTDGEVMELARENLVEFGDTDFVRGLEGTPLETPGQAWAIVNKIWEGDPGGRGWQARVPAGATWLSLRDDQDDPARGGGPGPMFGFGEPPVGEGAWEKPGY